MSGKVNSSSTAEWVRSSSESGSMTPPLPLNSNINRSNISRPPGGGVRSETSSNVSASQVFTKWLMKKQQKAGGSSENDSSGPHILHHHHQRAPMSSIGPGGVSVVIGRGQLFPARLALALGMVKTLLGVLLVAFGALALWEQASMSYLGSGELSSYLMRRSRNLRRPTSPPPTSSVSFNAFQKRKKKKEPLLREEKQ